MRDQNSTVIRGFGTLKALSFVFGPAERSLRESNGDPANDVDDALRELARFTDIELADIGLNRSCLSAEGLRAAGAKRARHQTGILAEVQDAERRERR